MLLTLVGARWVCAGENSLSWSILSCQYEQSTYWIRWYRPCFSSVCTISRMDFSMDQYKAHSGYRKFVRLCLHLWLRSPRQSSSASSQRFEAAIILGRFQTFCLCSVNMMVLEGASACCFGRQKVWRAKLRRHHHGGTSKQKIHLTEGHIKSIWSIAWARGT